MGKYKLTYFDGRGRAEVSRMLFAYAGQEYEDKRIKFEEWPELKKATLFGSMPLLVVDGEELCQSHTIERFLAKRFGLAGKTDVEEAKVNMIIDCVEDTVKLLPQYRFEQDEAKKAALKKKFEDDIVGQLANLEKMLKLNKGGDGFFVGNDLTVADLVVVHYLTFYDAMGLNKTLPTKMKAHKQRVESLPKIAQWIAKRPKTQF